MIKPVKRNKRLKWIDSHYAKAFQKPTFRLMVNAKPFNKAMRKAIKAVNELGKAMDRLKEG